MTYLDPDSLRCFLAVASEQSFRRASERLHLTPSAVTTRIQGLEDTLGVLLFRRTTRSVALTAEGHRLITPAETVLQSVQRCFDQVNDGGEQPVHISLGTRYELGLSWLLPAIQALEAAHPEWQIDLRFGDSAELMAQVLGADGFPFVEIPHPISSASIEALEQIAAGATDACVARLTKS